MTDDAIQALIHAFLDARGAGASERELFDLVKAACMAERERAETMRQACEYALAIAEDRAPGTWDDVMFAMRRALD